MRFHGVPRTDVVAHDYAHADGDARVVLLAHLGGRIVAVAGYDRLREPIAAEVAFAVADEMHGRGLATRMLEQLAEVAAARGIVRFDADVMAGNRAMLGVFAGAGFDVRRETEFGEVYLSLDLRPSARLEEHVADRTHVATVASARSSAGSSPAGSPVWPCRSIPMAGWSPRRARRARCRTCPIRPTSPLWPCRRPRCSAWRRRPRRAARAARRVGGLLGCRPAGGP
jgi:GNAT superfamily N-acetyltransferase